MEKIIKIEEVTESTESWDEKAGYTITTDKQVIKLLIDNQGQCCEKWGYFMSEDNLDQFIGANIIDLSLTDTELNSQTLEDDEDCYGEYKNCMFVNINTDRGILQFTAYNEHNGYYGHDAYVISEQLTHNECL